MYRLKRLLILVLLNSSLGLSGQTILLEDPSNGIGSNPLGKMDVKVGGWNNIPTVSFAQQGDHPSIRLYRPTGTSAIAYPWWIENNKNLSFKSGAVATMGSENVSTLFTLSSIGRVGIGIEQPEGGLHFKSSANQARNVSNGIAFLKTSGTNYSIQVTSAGGIPHIDLANEANEDYDIRFGLYEEKKLGILGGDVGIGLSAPSERLHVKDGNVQFEFNSVFDYDPIVKFENDGTNADIYQSFYRWSGNSDLYWATRFERVSLGGFKIQMADPSALGSHTFSDAMVILNSGSVGIATSTTGSHKLAVGGSIGAREIKVEVGDWSDFVFKEDYKLPTLEEVEEHIAEKGHLPEIPSEAEVTANGINLGEMDAKLLQKIEELTLYVIELNKENKAQQAEIEELKQMNVELMKAIKAK